MKDNDFSTLIALFNEQSSVVKNRLTKALHAVKDGRAPSSDEMASLNETVTSLREQYDAIYAAAERLLLDAELPEYGTSVDAITITVEKSRTKWIEEQLGKAKGILTRFLGVQSMIGSYAAALKPYQEEAATYLHQLTEETVEQLLPETEGPELFLQAMDIENIHSVDGIALVKSMKAYFPEEEIQYGLVGRQFYDAAPTEAVPAGEANAEETDAPSAQNSGAGNKPATEGDQTESPITPVTVMPSEQQTAADSEPEPAHSQTESDSVKRNISDASADAASEVKKYAVVNRVKMSKPSASGFRNDILRMERSERAISAVLPLFTNLGVLTREQIHQFRACMQSGTEKAKENLDSALDILVSRGYLAQFCDDQQNELFCLSNYCAGCLRKDKIQKMKSFWAVSCGNVYVTADREIDASVVLRFSAANQTLLSYLNTQREELPHKQFEQVMSSIKWVNDHYQVALVEYEVIYMAVTVTPDTKWRECSAACLIIDGNICEPSIFDAVDARVYLVDGRKMTLYGGAEGQSASNHEKPQMEQALEVSSESAEKEQKSVTLGTDTADAEHLPPKNEPESGQNGESTNAEVSKAEPVQEQPVTAETSKDETLPEHFAKAEPVQGETMQEEPVKAESPKVELVWKQPPKAGAVTAGTVLEPPVKTEIPAAMPARELLPQAETARRESHPVKAASTDNRAENPESLTMQHLLTLDSAPSDEEFCGVIHTVLAQAAEDGEQLTSVIVQTVLLAKGAGLETDRPMSLQLSDQMQLATDLFLDERHDYSSKCLSAAFAEKEEEVPALTLAAYMYAMLKPAEGYDYGLNAQTNVYFDDYDSYFAELPQFKKLFNLLRNIRDIKAEGFTPSVVTLLSDEDKNRQFVESMSAKAREYLEVKVPPQRINALPAMYRTLFGEGSNFNEGMKLIINTEEDEDCLELLDAILEDYCDAVNGVYTINAHKLDEQLDKVWELAKGPTNAKKKFNLSYVARDCARRDCKQRVELLISWADFVRNRLDSQKELTQLKALKAEIKGEVLPLSADTSWHSVQDANVLRWMLQHMSAYLDDESRMLHIYGSLLGTGVFSLSDEGTPILEESLSGVKYYEMWRNALLHISTKPKSSETLVGEILGESAEGDDDLKDNLQQLKMLGRLTGRNTEMFEVSDQQRKEAKRAADVRTDQFREKLELAYTYCQINETEKENLMGMMNQYQKWFYDIGDFASWRRFLAALERQIDEMKERKKRELQNQLNAKLEKDKTSQLLKKAEQFLEQNANFAVTEEYLNRYESGERDLENGVLTDTDYFADFLSPAVFDPLLQECIRHKRSNLASFGAAYLDSYLPVDWTITLRKNSKKLVSNWPAGLNAPSAEQVKELFAGLGFPVKGASKVSGKEKKELWRLTVKPVPRGMSDYLHPIAAFGTQMKSSLNAIFLYGKYTEQQLVDTITSMNLGGISVVLINSPIDVAGRRKIGEIFHTQTSGQNPFLLIDQVLFLYLAMHEETQRLPALLKCTLPYSTYQPFVRDGGSTADEMFCGRTRELATIMDLNGACVVYGGRQLGKTALLERAESRCSKPENRAYAVYSTITRIRTEQEVVQILITDITSKTNGAVPLKPCKTLGEMCNQLRPLFRSGQIASMHLLIDEVDSFLNSIADDEYRQLQPLVDLRRETKNNFKFVIAGLHNVCRAKNATEKNGVFGQLGTPLCIKPLSPADALQLLSKPLRYLGFQIDENSNLETILTTTNYYPGILQFYGYMLVETLTDQYAKYYSAVKGNPPFVLRDDQLGAVTNSSDLNKSIKDKFRWSLELDSRYFMIARCIAWLYHANKQGASVSIWEGFSPEEIKDVADAYDIHCLENATRNDYVILMDEMVEMGILGKSKDQSSFNKYRLRRSSFVDIIGENEDVLDKDIRSNNVEE